MGLFLKLLICLARVGNGSARITLGLRAFLFWGSDNDGHRGTSAKENAHLIGKDRHGWCFWESIGMSPRDRNPHASLGQRCEVRFIYFISWQNDVKCMSTSQTLWFKLSSAFFIFFILIVYIKCHDPTANSNCRYSV